MLDLSLLVSGGLGATILQKLYLSEHIVAVLTNAKSTVIINFCQEKQIPCFVGNPRKGATKQFLKDKNCDLLLSVNYLFLVEEDLIRWPKYFAINLHGSLLPKYRGRTPHVWAIINGENQTGITAHLMEVEVDNGAIVEQVVLPIGSEDTGAMILEKFQEQYPVLVERIIKKVKENSLTSYEQDSSQATYFGKRTPLDGEINWEWSKERIRNWVRAQAAPYPGAFFFDKEEKIVVHKATYSNKGFDYQMPNGTFLEKTKHYYLVKVGNGVIRMSDLKKI
ncbi:MAG: methionyl-tRNA formyltransferase [Aureispira sp.]